MKLLGVLFLVAAVLAGVSIVIAQEQGGQAVEVRVWESADDPSLNYLRSGLVTGPGRPMPSRSTTSAGAGASAMRI